MLSRRHTLHAPEIGDRLALFPVGRRMVYHRIVRTTRISSRCLVSGPTSGGRDLDAVQSGDVIEFVAPEGAAHGPRVELPALDGLGGFVYVWVGFMAPSAFAIILAATSAIYRSRGSVVDFESAPALRALLVARAQRPFGG